MKLPNNPALYLAQKMWKYSKGNRKSVVLYAIFFVIGNSIALLVPLAIGKVFNIIQEQGVNAGNLDYIFLLLGSTVIISLAFWAFHGPARCIEIRNAFIARANYKNHLLEGVMDFPMDWHSNHHSGDTIDKIEKGTRSLFDFSSATFMTIEAIVRLVVSITILAYFNIYSLPVVFVMIFTAAIIIMRFDKVLVRQYKILFGFENKITEKIFDVISNITTVILLRAEKMVTKAISKKIEEPFSLFNKNQKINETKWFLVSCCSVSMTALVLMSYIYQGVASGSVVLVGTLFILYGYVDKISDIFFRFAELYGEMLQRKSAVMNAEEIANDFFKDEEIKESILGKDWKELKIEALGFSYHSEDEGELHLDGISMSIRNGERIALIGESGSGKTTLLKIIRELYVPKAARVFVDGRILKEGFKAISDSISLIPQDPEIFSTTIEENITIGVNHSKGEIKKFTDMACFSSVVEKLPNGLDSFIFEKGVNLSGGEKQRLALARGLMASKDKSIIMLDEPTSSMDMKNELNIFQNIFQEFPEKTIIASVHRLHLLSLFDKVYFFQKGKIIASGTLESLIVDSEEFRKQWEKSRGAKRNNKIEASIEASKKL
ncbi:MAG: ABC transporter ATP-binding protein [Parcubacteria group bacterium]|jgi:ABC-type multidrug transport system fused ATPase/permease subunit